MAQPNWAAIGNALGVIAAELPNVAAHITAQLAAITNGQTQAGIRAINHGADGGPFTPLPDLNGAVPANFPADRAAIDTLTSAQLNDLLVAYQLPTTGNLTERRRRLAAFIGAHY